MVEGGEPRVTTEYEFRDGISTSSRFVKGGGYMLKVPAIDIAEVGAGGGSIARHRRGRPAAGRAGDAPARDPGPACYGPAAREPTVTDANVVLGLPQPARAGRRRAAVDAALSRAAIEAHVARAARARGGGRRARHPPGRQRQHGARDPRGHDRARPRPARPRAGRVRRQRAGACGRRRAARSASAACWCRPVPGVFTAVGMLAATSGTSSSAPLAGAARRRATRPRASARSTSMAAEARAALAGEGYRARRAVQLRYAADLRYVGQSSELTIPMPGAAGRDAIPGAARGVRARVRARPTATAERRAGRAGEPAPGRPPAPRRAGSTSARPDAAGAPAPPATSGGAGVLRARRAARSKTPVVARAAIDRAGPAPGPLIIESYDTTVVVPPGARASARDARSDNLMPHARSMARMIDPITFAVIKNALDAIVDEMAYTVIRTARSEIVKDVMDYSAALCDAQGAHGRAGQDHRPAPRRHARRDGRACMREFARRPPSRRRRRP